MFPTPRLLGAAVDVGGVGVVVVVVVEVLDVVVGAVVVEVVVVVVGNSSAHLFRTAFGSKCKSGCHLFCCVFLLSTSCKLRKMLLRFRKQ